MDWREARRRASRVERTAEEAVSRYSSLVASFRAQDDPASGNGDEEAGGLLEQEGDLRLAADAALDEMRAAVHALSEAATPNDASSHAVVERFHDVLRDTESELRRAQGAFSRSRETYELFHGAKSRHPDSATGALLRERSVLESTHQEADGILGQALASRSALREQTRMLQEATSRLGRTAQRLPFARTIIRALGSRRQRENLIVATAIAACLCFLFWYSTR